MDKIKELFASYINDKVSPGISIALIKDGDIVYSQCYGYSNLENKIKINLDTTFYLASVSKAFTAATIMLLHERQLLNIEDNINLYFSDLPECCDKVTIKSLIHHTSGLKDYFIHYLKKGILSERTNEDVYRYIQEQNTLEFEAGEKFNYTNTGYTLLSMLVERISGQTYSEFVKKNIFNHLGMNNTVVYTPDKPIVSNRAYGYKVAEGCYYVDDYSLLTTGDGGMYSCIRDLSLWCNSLDNEIILSRNSLNTIFTSGNLNDGAPSNYGYGWFIKEIGSKKVAFHDGCAFGFRTFVGKCIAERFSVIILTNCYRSEWDRLLKNASKIILELNNFYI